MVTGDPADIRQRLRAVLPPWFGDNPPLLGAILSGIAALLSFVYGFYLYAAAQTRLATMSGAWLDLFAQDFLGGTLARKTGQSDDSFRNRIEANLFRERATRAGMVRALRDLTGFEPQIFEPRRPLDTGAYGYISGYGVAGGYGSMLLPFQCFLKQQRPLGKGIPMIAGYGIPVGAYRTPSLSEYGPAASTLSGISDDDIYAAIDATKPVGTIIWTAIGNFAAPQTMELVIGSGRITLTMNGILAPAN